jgi:hypothetical protein
MIAARTLALAAALTVTAAAGATPAGAQPAWLGADDLPTTPLACNR